MAVMALCLLSCTEKKEEVTLSGLKASNFVAEVDGKTTGLSVLKNQKGMEVCVTSFGGRIVSIMVPDKRGLMRDVVLGFDNVQDYMTYPTDFGATIGQYANRINQGKFTLDGVDYQLPQNNFGHCLHGGPKGFQYQIFDVEQPNEQVLELSYLCKDGEEGFPGNVQCKVVMTLTDDNAIDLKYSAETDKPTIVNMTNHSYFNLSGKLTTTVKDHILWLDCPHYTPIDSKGIPTGEIRSVKESIMDFTELKRIGDGIESGNVELKKTNGYDHNFCVRNWDKSLKRIGQLYEEKSGRCMEVFTDLPGIQIYTGNYLGRCRGRDRKIYKTHGAVCMETQYFPNHINEENFVSAIFDVDNPYDSTTIYKFSVK